MPRLFSVFFILFSIASYSQSKNQSLSPYQDENLKWGYKNAKGKIIVKPVFDQALAFDKSVALVKQNSKWGMLNFKGILTINPEYDSLLVLPLSEIIAAGKQKVNDTLPNLHFATDWHWGLLNLDGKIVQQIRFKKIDEVEKNVFFLTTLPQWQVKKANSDSVLTLESSEMFLKETEKPLDLDTIPLIWDWRMPYKLGRSWGFVDSVGLMRISNRYQSVKSFDEGLAAVRFNGKWGFIDKDEKIIIQPNYDLVSEFENGFCIAKRAGKFGTLNASAKEITGFQYDSIFIDESGVAITEKSHKKGLIGKTGYEVLPPRFDNIFPQYDFNIIVSRANKFGLFDERGNIIFPVQYDGIYYEKTAKNYILMKKGETARFALPELNKIK